MHSAFRAPHSAPRRPTLAIAHGFAESALDILTIQWHGHEPRRSQEKDARKVSSQMAYVAHVCVVLRSVPRVGQTALGPARANVAYALAIPRPDVLPGSQPPGGPTGTGPRLTTVCFAWPVLP